MDNSNALERAANKKKNGLTELPPERLAAVEQGLAFFQTTAAERDVLKKELDQMGQELAKSHIENESLRGQINTMQSRVLTYQLERDQAVAQRAVYETLFTSFGVLLREFQMPTAPLVKPPADEIEETPAQ